MGIIRQLVSGWIRQKDGTTAIEFSLLAIPYVFLTIGIIELSMMYTAASMLEGATSSAARLIRTGQLQQSTSGNPQELFQAELCAQARVLINCGEINFEVVNMDSFADIATSQANFDGDGNLVSQGFNPGGVNAKVLVRVVYRYRMMTPFVGQLLTGPTNSRLFMSTIVLQTEPYQFVAS